MPAQRKRKQFKFWLNILSPQEKYLTDVVAWLTEQGEFVRSIRDGLRLIYDLRFQKDTRSLVELFPDIRQQLQLQTTSASGGGGQLDEIKGLLEMIASQQSNTGYLMKSTPVTLPVAEFKQASAASVDTIADNVLNAFF